MRKNQPKGLGENSPPTEDRRAPASSERHVVSDEITAYAGSVRARLGISLASGEKGKATSKILNPGDLKEIIGQQAVTQPVDPAKAEKRKQVFEKMKSELEILLEKDKVDLAAKARILKEAILALDPEDRAVKRGKVQFLIQTCVPNIKRDRLNALAQSLVILIDEGRKLDSTLGEIVSTYQKNIDFPDLIMTSDSFFGGLADSSDPSAAGVMGLAYVGPNPDKPASAFDADEYSNDVEIETAPEIEG